MRRASFIALAAGILVLASAGGASAQDAGEEPRRSGWYVGGGVGANWASNISQSGWNRDPLCYPTDACFDLDPRPEVSGYRWHYDIAAATGPRVRALGRLYGEARACGARVRANVERPRPDVP